MYRKEAQSLSKCAFQHHHQYTTHRTGPRALWRLWMINLRSHLRVEMWLKKKVWLSYRNAKMSQRGGSRGKKKKREPTQIRGPRADPPCEDQFSPLNYEHVKICQNIFLWVGGLLSLILISAKIFFERQLHDCKQTSCWEENGHAS